jgi:L-alanine-DL-glutamate epimerase-like enolase superfamily enzyme
MDVEVQRVALRLREPLRTAWGELRERDLVRVRVSEGGLVGVGEAGSLPGFDDLTDQEALAAALDVATWDLMGKREGRPVAALLAAEPLASVPVNALVGAEDRAGAARQAAAAAAEGFRCVKVKVGVGDDAGRLAAVRAAVGPAVAIRIDANRAWSAEEAIAQLRALAPVGVELCEEPAAGVEALRAVRSATEVPVAMDETSWEADALASGAADAICLRVGAHGGITGVVRAAAVAREAGSDVYVASTFDGPIGIAAALHAAAGLRVGRPCGLATLRLMEGVEDPFPLRDGAFAVPTKPGLGSDPLSEGD